MAPPRASPIDPALDQTSPFFVHPSDGPGSVTVLPKVTGSNYHSWAQSMKRALVFTVGIGKQPLIFQKVTYLVTRRIDQIDPKTWLISGFGLSLVMIK